MGPLHFSGPASGELSDAVRFYERQRGGLGGEFFDAVSETLDLIARHSQAGMAVSPDGRTRRLLVRRFPYQIVYRVRPGEIVVVALAHAKRRPDYWKYRD